MIFNREERLNETCRICSDPNYHLHTFTTRSDVNILNLLIAAESKRFRVIFVEKNLFLDPALNIIFICYFWKLMVIFLGKNDTLLSIISCATGSKCCFTVYSQVTVGYKYINSFVQED